MGKANSGDRSSQVAKAGKRSGMVTYPAPASPEKLAARAQGEQQFIAKRQLSIEKEVVKYDEKRMRFVSKLVNLPVDFQFDPTRGRLVMSPILREKKVKGDRS